MGKRICLVDGCDRPRKGFGYCSKHYQRLKRHGSVHQRTRELTPCAGPECERLVDAIQGSGLCRSHYKQKNLGKPLTPLLLATKDPGRPKTCGFPNCQRPHKARGWCKGHYDYIKVGREPKELGLRLPPGPCSVEGCERLRHSTGYCNRHYSVRISRWRDYGMTPEQGDALYLSQDSACAVCRERQSLDDLHIDHDHSCCERGRGSCGRCVRGLLCQACNVALGFMKDDPHRMNAAALYLMSGNLRPLV